MKKFFRQGISVRLVSLAMLGILLLSNSTIGVLAESDSQIASSENSIQTSDISNNSLASELNNENSNQDNSVYGSIDEDSETDSESVSDDGIDSNEDGESVENDDTEGTDCEHLYTITSYEAGYLVEKCTECDEILSRQIVDPSVSTVKYAGNDIERDGQWKKVATGVLSANVSYGNTDYVDSIKDDIAVTLNYSDNNASEDSDYTVEGTLSDTDNVYTWDFSNVSKGSVYTLNYIEIKNTANNSDEKYYLNLLLTNVDSASEYNKINYTISAGSKELFNSTNNSSDVYWYSSIDNEDTLTINLSGELYEDFTITSFYELDSNGDKIIYSPISEQHDKNIIFGWDWINRIIKKWFTTSYKYSVPATEDGIHVYYMAIQVGDDTYNNTIYTYIDNKRPDVTVKYFTNGTEVYPKGWDVSYYNENMTVEVTVLDAHVDSDASSFALYSINGDEIERLTLTSSDATSAVYSCTVSDDGYYYVSGKGYDLAGNSFDNEIKTFTIDKTNPIVKVTFDNNDVLNGKYYKESRTATITVTEKNFSTADSDSTLIINSKLGEAQIGQWESIGNDQYTKQVTFDADGIYSFVFTCKDEAGNSSNESDGTVGEFVIDTTAPTITVSFDNNSSKNTYYYNKSRTATITINDISFSDSLVSIAKTGEAGLCTIPSMSSFEQSDYDYTASITFDTDGKYAFRLSCTDLAGNKSENYVSDVFYIDTISPVIDITGVENMSANNGSVTPTISATDENIQDDDISISVVGSNNGEILLRGTSTTITDGYKVKLEDIPHEKSMDDLYTLTVTVADKAGNEATKEIQYSINRFGSVYVLSNGTKSMVDNYYVTRPQDVVITEINVDTLSYKDVSVAYDGNVKELTENRNYTTSDLTNSNSWHSITYTINASNFKKDGIYSVTVYSEDKATNKQSNQTKDAEISFLLDTTAPSVVVSGVEDGGVYEEASHDFTINATDTIGIKNLEVLVDNNQIAQYSADELNVTGGTEQLTVDGKDDYQQVVIVCTDVAGNETRLAYNNILISQKAEELLIEGGLTPTSTGDDSAGSSDGNISMSRLLPIVATILVVIAIATIGTAVAYRKKVNK